MRVGRLIVLAFLALGIVSYFYFNLGEYLSFEYLKSAQHRMTEIVEADPVAAILVFTSLYIGVTALSLPGAAIMTLAAGGILGLSGVLSSCHLLPRLVRL